MKEEQAIEQVSKIVSRETMEKFNIIQQQLVYWSKRHNLVAASSLPHFWTRHVLDSVQLFDLAPKTAKNWLDMGSGAGFPGVILAIMLRDRAGAKMTLIEANGKKTAFLKHCAREAGVPITVLQQRIENVLPQKVDVITARALSSLSQLLEFSLPFCQKQTILIFPKGKTVAIELAKAELEWELDLTTHLSITDSSASILCIRNVSRV